MKFQNDYEVDYEKVNKLNCEKFFDIVITNERCIDIYKKESANNITNELIKYFNDCNTKTSNMIDKFEKELRKQIFKLPCFEVEKVWGKETIFYPFSNKLYKIINTYRNDTSLQIHPLKNEGWIALSDSCITDGIDTIEISSNNYVEVNRSTVHGIKKDSVLFEIQDNVLFEDNETIRINDTNGRDTSTKKEIYKYLLPMYRNYMSYYDIDYSSNNSIISNSCINNIKDSTSDLFIFIIDGEVLIEDKQLIKLDEQSLYYINRNIVKNIEKINGNVYIEPIKYFQVKDK